MYNPYVRKGEWIDCDKCGSAHRRIVPSDLENYTNEDGIPAIVTEEESTRCYKCSPLPLYIRFHCISCHYDGVLETFYDTSKPTVCPSCGVDNKEDIKHVGLSHFEKRPTLKGEAAELFNRIKKRNYGSTMPDY